MIVATPIARAGFSAFRLICRSLSAGVADVRFDAPGLEAAYARAGTAIAEHHGMPGAYVALDRQGGSFTVGAGYRSHRGTFVLEPWLSATEVSALNLEVAAVHA